MKVIRKIKSTINHSSDRVNFANKKCNGPNSIRGVINKNTPYAASLVLLPSLAILAMFMVVFMGMPMNVYAADDDGDTVGHPGRQEETSGETTPNTTNTTSATFTVQDAPSLSVTLSTSSVVLNISPTADGQFGRASMTLDVSTNNTTGYNLTMAADTTPLSRSAAVNGETPTIPTLTKSCTCTDETAATCDNFPNNHWGYKVADDGNKYLPISATATSIKTTHSASNSDITTLYFATKLDNSLPTGNYGTNLTFIATTNAVPFYMQDVTADALATFTPNIGDTYTLRDNRDNHDYSIAKLSDSNYYMTQNLAFSGTELTPQNSDVVESTTVVWYQLDDIGSCDYETNGYNYACIKTSDTYGAWYNYAAATAMEITGMANSGNPTHSICPRRWTLPNATQLSNIINDKDNFSPVAGGIYFHGVHSSDADGLWWSSTLGEGAWSRKFLVYNHDKDGALKVMDDGNRTAGYYIRCVFKGE